MHKSTPDRKNIPTIPIVSITKLKTFSFIIRTVYFKGSFSNSLQNYTIKKTLHVRSEEINFGLRLFRAR